MLLDASQAFDRVQYVKLFKLLLQRGTCPLTARFLARLYTSQSISVQWNGQKSRLFTTSNGVKQGAILSPILFCVYMDELLLELKKSSLGCHIGTRFCGSLGYADDVCVMAPSRYAIQRLLDICDSFALKYDVKFNSSKSQLLLFNCPSNVCPITLNGNPLSVSLSGIHLGHPIGQDSDISSISKGISDIVYRTNCVMSKFGHCNSDIRSHMFETYCSNYYGCPIWNLKSNYINRFYINWRKCVRKIWRIPQMTHGRILDHLINGSSIKCQLFSRFLVFYYNTAQSDNVYVSLCSKLCKYSSTNAAYNLRMLLHMLNDNGECFNILRQPFLRKKLHDVFSCSNECASTGMCVRDLCLMRDGAYNAIYDTNSLNVFLCNVCID